MKASLISADVIFCSWAALNNQFNVVLFTCTFGFDQSDQKSQKRDKQQCSIRVFSCGVSSWPCLRVLSDVIFPDQSCSIDDLASSNGRNAPWTQSEYLPRPRRLT